MNDISWDNFKRELNPEKKKCYYIYIYLIWENEIDPPKRRICRATWRPTVNESIYSLDPWPLHPTRRINRLLHQRTRMKSHSTPNSYVELSTYISRTRSELRCLPHCISLYSLPHFYATIPKSRALFTEVQSNSTL